MKAGGSDVVVGFILALCFTAVVALAVGLIHLLATIR